MIESAIPRYVAAAGEQPRAPGRPVPSAPFITISREPGAGGLTLAEALVSELAARGERDWSVFGAQAFREAVREAELEPPANLAEEERYEGTLGDLFYQLMGAPPQDSVMRAAFRAMRRRAELGRVVFVGHGAVFATRDLGGVHVSLVASRASRRRRLASRYSVSEDEARRLERDLGASRRAFFRWHFQHELDDPLLYDLTINTDLVLPFEAARILVDLVLSRRAVASP